MNESYIKLTPKAVSIAIELSITLKKLPQGGRIRPQEPYDWLWSLSSHSYRDLVSAYRQLSSKGGLEVGGLDVRSGSGLMYIKDDPVYIGPRGSEVPDLLERLLEWSGSTEVHPLIRGVVVRYGLESIRPFDRYNSKIALLWQLLIFKEWDSSIDWLSLGLIDTDKDIERKEVLLRSLRASDSSVFVEYVLQSIYETVKGAPSGMVEELFDSRGVELLSGLESDFLRKIAPVLNSSGQVANREAQTATGLSAESVKKYLARLVEVGLIESVGEKKGRRYVIARHNRGNL